MNMKALAVIPAYNEAQNIEKVVQDILENAPDIDYVVINDGSKDNTKEILRQNNMNYIDGFCNLGLFGAVQTGFKFALLNKYDVVIQFDGDGQHSAKYISDLIKEIENGYNIVIGSRFVNEQKPWSARMIGSRLISSSIRLVTGKKISEMQTYANNFPVSLLVPEVKEHYWQFPWIESAMTQKSLNDKDFEPTEMFTERQITSITSPFDPPTYEGPTNLIIPPRLRRYFGMEQIHIHRVLEEVKEDNQNQEIEQIRDGFVRKYACMIKETTAKLLEDVNFISEFFKKNEDGESDLVSNIPSKEPETYVNNAELMFFQHELTQFQNGQST